MKKEKREKIILLILLPVFALLLIFKLMGRVSGSQPGVAAVVPVIFGQKGQTIELEIKTLGELKSKLKKVVYKANKSIDPLKNEFSAYMAKVALSGQKMATGAVKPPMLTVSGLIWNSNRPQAIVNENVLSVGDEIDGARLLSVSRDGIKVQYQGVDFFIKKQ